MADAIERVRFQWSSLSGYGRTAAAGFAAGVASPPALALVTNDVAAARGDVLGLGLLCVSLGALGWGGATLVSPHVSEAQRYFGAEPQWDEFEPRRVMARIVAFGAGVLAGVLLVSIADVA
jgi:hypothetical protein